RFEKHNSGEIDGVKLFLRETKPFARQPIQPLVRQHEEQTPYYQEPQVDNRTPQKRVAYALDGHVDPSLFPGESHNRDGSCAASGYLGDTSGLTMFSLGGQ